MKKVLVSFLLILAVCLNIVVLASCGNKNLIADFEIPEGGFDTEKEITIKFYHTMGANLREVLERYIVEFNKLYPNIKIEHQQVGSYDDVRDQIKTEITVGNQPHIAYCYPDHVALYNLAKAVVPLDSLIESDITVNRADGSSEILGLTSEQVSDFIKGYYEEGKQFGDGKMYTLPLSKSTEVLYYNKTFFDKHNLTPPKTWEEMEKLCEEIKKIDPNCIPLGYDSESNWFITMCEQYGSDYTSATGDHFLFDNDTNRKFVEEFRDWYQKGYVTTQELSGAYTSELFKAQDGIKSYMSIGSSAGATHQRPDKVNEAYPFEVAITTIPQVNADKPKVISQGPSICIFNKTDAQEVLASWLFVKYLTTTVEFQAEFSMASGYVPVLKSVGENEIYKTEFLDKADGGDFISALSAKICLEQQEAYYTSPAFNGSSTARDQVGLLMQKCLSADAGSDVKKMIKKAFEDAVQEIIFDQLQLKNTFFASPKNLEYFEKHKTLATGYDGDGLPLPGRFPPCPDLAGAGLWSTPKELLAIAKAFVAAFNGESDFLQEKSAREIAKPVDPFPWTGLGVFVNGEDTLMTQGWGENGQCMMKMNCRTGKIAVVMTNRNPEMAQAESGVEWLVNQNLIMF